MLSWRGVFYLLLVSKALMEWCHAAEEAGWVGREQKRVQLSCGRRNRAFRSFPLASPPSPPSTPLSQRLRLLGVSPFSSFIAQSTLDSAH
jgi:hypothetical protein